MDELSCQANLEAWGWVILAAALTGAFFALAHGWHLL